MRMRLIPILLAATALFGWADEFAVIYLAGEATLADSRYIETGDILKERDVVILEDGAVLELQGPTKSLTLVGPGRYSVSGLDQSRERRSEFSISGLLQSKLQRLVSGETAGEQSTVMGVRGSAADADELTWMDGESDLYINSGREYLQANQLPKAAESFNDGIETASLYGEFEAEMELIFLLSYTRALQGRRGEALTLLKQVSADPYLDWYPEYRLHHAELLLGAGANAEAATLLEADQEAVPLSDEEKLILGIALYDQGESEKSRGARILRELTAEGGEVASVAGAYLGR